MVVSFLQGELNMKPISEIQEKNVVWDLIFSMRNMDGQKCLYEGG